MTIKEKIDEYLMTRVAYDEAHEVSSKAYKQHQAAKAKLVDQMLAEQQQAVKFGDGEWAGMQFYLKSEFSISCTDANNAEVMDWLQEHYGDVHEFTTEKVHKKAVVDRLKSDIEGERLDEFEVPAFFNLKTRPDVTCTGYKQFSAQKRGK